MKTWKINAMVLGIMWVLLYPCTNVQGRENWFSEVSAQYTMGHEHGYTAGRMGFACGKYLNDWFGIRAESNIGGVMFNRKNKVTAVQTGGEFILRFDPKFYQNWRFFVEVGTGIGYVNRTGNEKKLIAGMTGLINGGVGFIFPIEKHLDFIIGYEYSHISSLRPGNGGLNMHGVRVGFRW